MFWLFADRSLNQLLDNTKPTGEPIDPKQHFVSIEEVIKIVKAINRVTFLAGFVPGKNNFFYRKTTRKRIQTMFPEIWT
jgi:hypothetical protein